MAGGAAMRRVTLIRQRTWISSVDGTVAMRRRPLPQISKNVVSIFPCESGKPPNRRPALDDDGRSLRDAGWGLRRPFEASTSVSSNKPVVEDQNAVRLLHLAEADLKLADVSDLSLHSLQRLVKTAQSVDDLRACFRGMKSTVPNCFSYEFYVEALSRAVLIADWEIVRILAREFVIDGVANEAYSATILVCMKEKKGIDAVELIEAMRHEGLIPSPARWALPSSSFLVPSLPWPTTLLNLFSCRAHLSSYLQAMLACTHSSLPRAKSIQHLVAMQLEDGVPLNARTLLTAIRGCGTDAKIALALLEQNLRVASPESFLAVVMGAGATEVRAVLDHMAVTKFETNGSVWSPGVSATQIYTAGMQKLLAV